jgi:hypothetical protein
LRPIFPSEEKELWVDVVYVKSVGVESLKRKGKREKKEERKMGTGLK